MDCITEDNLNQYEQIIENINEEFERKKVLEAQIQKEDDKIIIGKLTEKQSTNPIKFSQTLVKVFDDLSEVLSLYKEELNINDLGFLKYPNDYRFCLIEIYINKSLQDKLYSNNYMLNISVTCDNPSATNKTVKLPKESPIRQVFPLSKDIKQCDIKCRVYDTNNYGFLHLDTINVDISYYFQTFKTSKQKPNEILSIGNLYGQQNEDTTITSAISIENCDLINITNAFLKNSYHRLDLELFSEISGTGINNLCLGLNENKIDIDINWNSKCLSIKGELEDVTLVKKYLIKELNVAYPPERNKEKLQDLLNASCSFKDNEVQLHKELRKLFL